MSIVEDPAQLKSPCKPVSVEDGLKVVDQLAIALTASKILGCGLAANQIGIDARVCIVRVPKKDAQGFSYDIEIPFVNPTISSLKIPVKFSGEGCLSFPGKYCQTLRYRQATVVDDLQPEGRRLEGFAAIIAQHEIDHLNGITMLDRLYENQKPNSACPCGSSASFKACCRSKVKDF